MWLTSSGHAFPRLLNDLFVWMSSYSTESDLTVMGVCFEGVGAEWHWQRRHVGQRRIFCGKYLTFLNRKEETTSVISSQPSQSVANQPPYSHIFSRLLQWLFLCHLTEIFSELVVHLKCSPDWIIVTRSWQSANWLYFIDLIFVPSARPCIWCTEPWKGSPFPCPSRLPWSRPPRGKNPLFPKWCLCSPRHPQPKRLAPPTPPPRPCPTLPNLSHLLPQHQLPPLWVPEP